MEIITTERRGGKTYKLIQIAHAEGLVIVCFSSSEAKRVMEEAEFQEFPVEAISWGEYILGKQRGRGKRYVVDNIDLCLVDVEYISLTRPTYYE